MRQILLALLFFAVPAPASAWNAAGHRLTAVIAWQQLSPTTQTAIGKALSRHPDYERWVEKSRSSQDVDIFAEAATWPDDIRNDPRFYDDGREPATPALPGPPWLRGKRLQQNAARLLENHPAPRQGNVALWRDESHRLLAEAYPTTSGSLRPIVTEDFRQRSRAIAERRIVAAGYRLGRLLDDIFGQRGPGKTP